MRVQGRARFNCFQKQREGPIDRPPEHAEESEQAFQYRAAAKALIRSQRTMVLATAADALPWAAPVYYVYEKPGFYFFSSPRARHVQSVGRALLASAAIFADSDRWEEIQGLQMSGAVRPVARRREQVKVIARFLLKFPFARPFLKAEAPARGKIPYLGDRVRLYVFAPLEVFYLDNRLGFGRRMPVEIHG